MARMEDRVEKKYRFLKIGMEIGYSHWRSQKCGIIPPFIAAKALEVAIPLASLFQGLSWDYGYLSGLAIEWNSGLTLDANDPYDGVDALFVLDILVEAYSPETPIRILASWDISANFIKCHRERQSPLEKRLLKEASSQEVAQSMAEMIAMVLQEIIKDKTKNLKEAASKFGSCLKKQAHQKE